MKKLTLLEIAKLNSKKCKKYALAKEKEFGRIGLRLVVENYNHI